MNYRKNHHATANEAGSFKMVSEGKNAIIEALETCGFTPEEATAWSDLVQTNFTRRKRKLQGALSNACPARAGLKYYMDRSSLLASLVSCFCLCSPAETYKRGSSGLCVVNIYSVIDSAYLRYILPIFHACSTQNHKFTKLPREIPKSHKR